MVVAPTHFLFSVLYFLFSIFYFLNDLRERVPTF
jgi:hypothetical protein